MSTYRASDSWDKIFDSIKDIKNSISSESKESNNKVEKILIDFLDKRGILESIDWIAFSHKSVITQNTKYLFWGKHPKYELIADLFREKYSKDNSTEEPSFNQLYDNLEKKNISDNKKIAKVSINDSSSNPFKIDNTGCFLEFKLPKIVNNATEFIIINNNATAPNFYSYTNDQSSNDEFIKISKKFDLAIETLQENSFTTNTNEAVYKALTPTPIQFVQYLYLPFIFDFNSGKYFYFFPPLAKRDSNLLTISFYSKEIPFDQLDIFQIFISYISALFKSSEFNHLHDLQLLKTAIISILVDSFAHNIAAHSLSAMVWFLKQQGQKQIDSDLPYDICKKRFSALKKGIENGAGKQHLLDLIKEIDNNFVKNAPMEGSVQYTQYLCNKAAFWSGVTRDFECGGEIRSWYDVLKDFAENSIYLGTIAHAEGIHKVRIKVGCGEEKDSDQKTEEFAVAEFDVTKQSSNTSMELCNGQGCNKTSWKNLDKDKWKLFLPNGIVGLHALYTIFENTLRNIKHADPDELEKAKTEGIEFNIFIQSDDKHFNTTIWLGNKSKIMEEKTDEKGNVDRIGVDERISKLLVEDIITDNGTPRMGGSSQDKICASMLYNNVFSKVAKDNWGKYPSWICVKSESENGNSELGVVKRSFYVWKGADAVEIIPDAADPEAVERTTSAISLEDEEKIVKIKVGELEYENPARFKFVIVPKSEEKDLKEKLAERGIVRIMDESECSGDDLDSLYKVWNEKWVKCKEIIIFAGEHPYIYFAVILENNGWIIKDITEYCDNLMFESNIIEENKNILDDQENPVLNIKENNVIKKIPWKHKGTKLSDLKTLEWRSHGVLFSKNFIPEPKPKETLNFVVKNNQDEFIETLLTNIEIYDNRIFERVKTSEKKRPNTDLIDLYAKLLFLYVNDEKMEKTEFIKKTEKNEANFFIIHLSYIESMNFTENDINKFIKTCGISLNYNTKLVITTGRGRGEWHNCLDAEYEKHVLFKPIDSLLAAVEDGLMLNDDFQVKYNLAKVLFGS